MSFGTRLRQLRLERGFTQQELADPRFTAAFVSTLESGRRRPSRAALEHFARKLSVDPDELQTGISPSLRVECRARLQEARALLASGEVEVALTIAEEVKSIAERTDWKAELAWALVIKGRTAEQQARIDEAIEFYEAAEVAVLDLPLERVEALAGRTRCLQMKGDIRYAIHLLESHLRLLKEEGLEEPGALARLNTSLVAAYFDAGLRKQAENAARVAVELAPQVSDAGRLAGMHINTARVLIDRGMFEDARRSLDKAEELYVDLHWKNDIGRVYLARAFSLIDEGRMGDATSHLDKAIDIFRETGNVLNETRSRLQMGRVLRLTERPAEARMLLQGIGLRHGGVVEQGITRREIGLCFAQEGSVSEAVRNLQVAIELLEEAEDARELALTYRVLGDVMREARDLDEACDAYRNAAMALENAA